MIFREQLAYERIRAGYSSARSLVLAFPSAGIRMSYSHYTRIETGHLLPQISFVVEVAAFLKVRDFASLLKGYLVECGVRPELQSYLEDAFAESNPETSHDQLIRYSQERRHVLTIAQARAITTDNETYWVFLAMVLNRGIVHLEELESRGRIDRYVLDRIVERLVELGLLKKAAGGYCSLHPHVTFPPGFEGRIRQLSRDLSLAPAVDPVLWRSVFLKTSEVKMRAFRERVNRLAAEFLAQEEADPVKNDRLYLLSVQIQERNDFDLKATRATRSPDLYSLSV